MNKELRRYIRRQRDALTASDCSLGAIYDIMFDSDNVLCEYNDGYRVKKQTYGEVRARIERAAAGLFARLGATHRYVALAMDNSPDWIVAFWAILRSGNRPYLVNLRYPDSLTNGILATLGITHTVCAAATTLQTEHILIDSLDGTDAPPREVFEDEIAFSSSATSMNEVVCFYTGRQVAEQILCFEDIVRREPRIAAHYKGALKQLAFLPFYHVFGLFAVYFWFTFFGRTLVFLRDYGADTILRTCKKHNVTHIFAVPMLWHTVEEKVRAAAREQGEDAERRLERGLRLCTKIQDLFPVGGPAVAQYLMREVTDKLFGRSIKFCINGGSYLRDSALTLLNGIGYNTYNGYGMSEIGITSVELGRTPRARNKNAIGLPFTAVEYRLDEDGILWVRGGTLCVKKLINGVEQTHSEWFNTGDRVECRDGRYYILGRLGDTVIGENGENINPDTVERLLPVDGTAALSVLGLDGDGGQELSVVVQVSPYVTDAALAAIRERIYGVNDTLPPATAIRRFYFTTDPLCSETAIKVSRAALLRRIAAGEVTLTPFAEMQAAGSEGGDSPLTAAVTAVVAEVLGVDPATVTPTAHVFYDLGATSIQYFSILTRLSEEFSVTGYESGDKYCYTVKDICEYLEKRIGYEK